MKTINQLKNLKIVGIFAVDKAGEPDIRKEQNEDGSIYHIMEEAISVEQAIQEIDKIGIENFSEDFYRDGGSFNLNFGDLVYRFKVYPSRDGLRYKPFVLKQTKLEH